MRKIIKRVQRAISERRRYARTVEELNRLTDRELVDLGISRSDIKSIAFKNSKFVV